MKKKSRDFTLIYITAKNIMSNKSNCNCRKLLHHAMVEFPVVLGSESDAVQASQKRAYFLKTNNNHV